MESFEQFFEEHCVVGPDKRVFLGDLVALYREKHKLPPVRHYPAFSAWLSGKGFKYERNIGKNGARTVVGLGLKEEMVLAVPEKIAAEAGFYRKAYRNRPRWATRCDQCGAERIWLNWADNISLVAMQRLAKSAGWVRENGQWTCKHCVKRNAKMKTPIDAAPIPEPISPYAPPSTAAEPSIKLTYRVGEVIGQHFDESKRLYAAGWSDAKVAAETKASEAFVAKVRKEIFGELAEDPVVASIRAELGVLASTLVVVQDQLLAKFAEIEDQQKKLASRIEQLTFRKA
jgi:hypothetical protein